LTLAQVRRILLYMKPLMEILCDSMGSLLSLVEAKKGFRQWAELIPNPELWLNEYKNTGAIGSLLFYYEEDL